MGKIDNRLKQMLGIDDVFADLVNGCLFDGKTVLTTENISPRDTTLTATIDIKGKNINEKLDIQKFRDVIKKTDLGFSIAIIGVEDQAAIDYSMIVRTMLYDALSYELQVRERRNESESQGKKIAYTQGMEKDSTIYPVISIIFYTGQRKWDAAKSLYDLFGFDERQKEIADQIMSNYHIKVIDAAHMGVNEIKKYKNDMAAFFHSLSESARDEKEKMDEKIYHPETLMALAAVTGQEKYMEMASEFGAERFEKGVADMDILNYVEEKGRAKGREEGREEGIQVMVSVLLDLNTEYSVILGKLKTSYQLPTKKAEEYIQKGMEEKGMTIKSPAHGKQR